MSDPEVITCGDLARLAGPWDRLWQHDPRALDPAHDVLCHCWNGAGPEDVDGSLECGYAFLIPLDEARTIHLCCLCSSYYAGVLRAQGAEALWAWLQGQVDEALAFRDQRRLDPSPVAADMDVEAVALDPPDEWNCAGGTPEEDHDWLFVGGDPSTGAADSVECQQCGATRDAEIGDLPSEEP